MESKLNILVIDDNADLRDFLRQILEKLGCAVATAASAETGKEELLRRRYDAVFASLCLERFGARRMAQWAQENTAGRAKFFVTTGWQGELEPDLLRYHGIHDVLRKPFSLDVVREKIRGHLGEKAREGDGGR
ncbi:MAG: response regulator [Chitinispirillaceae bacterium]|nr:response regulator [Chitinispirillaceae bacterium]